MQSKKYGFSNPRIKGQSITANKSHIINECNWYIELEIRLDGLSIKNVKSEEGRVKIVLTFVENCWRGVSG